MLSLGCLLSVGANAEPTAGQAPVSVANLVNGVCATCHGPRGISVLPKYPRLAGQNANYLMVQLMAFRSRTRGDADAVGFMWGMAAQLDDPTIEALATYYSQQKPIAGRSGDTSLMARGNEIFNNGLESEGVPACSACHGTQGQGMADFPRLAGQHEQYLLKQLGAFQNNMRDVAVMHGVAAGLKSKDMQAVAAFLQAQP